MTPTDYEFLKKFLKTRSGLVLNDEKQYLIESRLLPVVREKGMETISNLVSALQRPGATALETAVVEAMTTNESFFFRDKTPFDNFRDVMMPALIKSRATRRKLRIWCAAASTGQEPYSLAMCLEEFARQLAGWRIEIIGTDIASDVLEKAKAGIYSQFEVQRGLPVQLLLKNFSQVGDLWQISNDMRSKVQWRQLNLLDSFAQLGEFDIVFCRNVLIYFDQETKTDVLNRVAKQLSGDGFMVLGAAETVVGLTSSFAPVPQMRGLYQRKEVDAPAAKPALSGTGSLASAGALR
ncbi:MAG: protein-glutamate O-methyltransferase CheR [Stappiaceae bacterium]